MSRSRVRNVVTAAVACVLLGVLAACASIPDSGAVRQGGPIAQVNDPLDLDFNPSPPAKGATPERIVQGFIDAASSPKNGFQIAREYLTKSMSATWNPDESVTVDDGRNRSYEHDGNQWTVDVTPVANVDSVGGYHPVASTAPVSLRYKLEREDNEWRIAVAPNGVVIDDPTFHAVYAQQNLYFYSPDFAYLVPDARWFPARVASAATRVTSAVLDGSSKWLSHAVSNAFPDGTKLAFPSVTTEGGIAKVDLSSQAGQADTLGLERMQVQLEASLGTLAQSVQLSIEGNVQQIPPISDSNRPLQDPPVDSHPIVARAGQFGLLNGSSITPISGLSEKIVALQPSSVALTAPRDAAAVLSHGAAYLVRRTSDALRVDARPGLIAPAIDVGGWVWTVPGDAPGAVQATGADGAHHSVKTAWPAATQILSLQISRDGTRVVALIKAGGTVSLVAAGITRGQGGVPTALSDPLELAPTTGTARSVAWVGQLDVVVLSTTAANGTSIAEQTIGGQVATTSGPAGGVTIVGAGGLSRYLVLTAAQSLQAPTGTGWQEQTDKVTAVAVQQGQP